MLNSKYLLYKRILRKVQQPRNFSSSEIDNIIKIKLGIKKGDSVLMHSSLYKINLKGVSIFDLVKYIKDLLGLEGNLLMPAFNPDHYNYLYTNDVFDPKLSKQRSGLVNEILLRDKESIRSSHPLKSVVCWGRNCRELTSSHHLSEYSFDKNSPFNKMLTLPDCKIVGFGVDIRTLSFIHTVEDTNLNLFSNNRYSNPTLASIICQDNNIYSGLFRHSIQDFVPKQNRYILQYLYKNSHNCDLNLIYPKNIPFYSINANKLYNDYKTFAQNILSYNGSFYY